MGFLTMHVSRVTLIMILGIVNTPEVEEEVDRIEIARSEEQKGKEKRQIAAAAGFLSQEGR
jgi:diacylglycerol kinase